MSESKFKELNLGDVVESEKLFGKLHDNSMFGKEVKVVGLSYHILSEETGILTELKVWHKDFDPSEYED